MKETLIIYRDWWEAIRQLPPELQFKAFDSICEYAFEGKHPEDSIIGAVTALMRSAIDRDRAKYEEICKRNKENIKKRWERRIQVNTKNTTVYDRIQVNTKNTDNDNEYDNDNDNDNDISSLDKSNSDINKKISSKDDIKKDNSANAESHRKSDESRVDYEKLKNFFNKTLEENHSTISRINTIDKTRRGMLNSRIQEYGKEAVVKVFQKAASSKFLNGDNQRGYIANFNWIIRPTNFLKILEGSYDNKELHHETDKSDKFSKRRGVDTAARSPEDYTGTL